MNLIEKGPGYASGLRDFGKYFNPGTLGAGIIAAIMGCTGPALLIITAGQDAGLEMSTIESWLFSVYFFGGLITIILALYYKQSICGAWSIPGVALVAAALAEFSFNEVVFAYILAGVIVLVIGFTGLVRKVMMWIPRAVVMGMVAGALFKFGLNIFPNTVSLPAMALPMIAIWVLFTLYRTKLHVPGVLMALVLGVVIAIAMGLSDFSGVTLTLAKPQIFTPVYSTGAIVGLAIPLALIVITAENTQAMGVLMSIGKNPPVNAMTLISGIGGIITGIFGGHNANIAGPMTAITSSPEAGPVEGRYVGSTVDGILFGAFGIIAGAALSIVSVLPKVLINVVVGLTMVGVLSSALTDAWHGKFKYGAFFAFFFTASLATWFKIGAPFWGLLFGTLLSYILDREDWKEKQAASEKEAAA
ncbi:MAG: benzoate transporter [Dehalococcoidia bacterium]|nr:MAG: benzoate transporter [Dehalococcoidia bacterium]